MAKKGWFQKLSDCFRRVAEGKTGFDKTGQAIKEARDAIHNLKEHLEKTPEPVTPPAPIKKAAVIGAGVMGAGIAAQIANAGIDVVLLDIVPKDATDRNIIAKSAVERMVKTDFQKDPMGCGFMSPENAKRVTVGNVEDNMDMIADADWIIEVVLEKLEIKRNLFEKIEAHRKPGAVVSSNTSTLPLHTMAEGRSDDFKKHFMVTHFFNPPRLMPLIELVRGVETSPDAMKKIKEVCEVHLGKLAVECNDTPGFNANRIGAYFIKRTINEAVEKGMKIEDVDAVMGLPLGFPKMGIFNLTDTVGVDLSNYVTQSLRNTLPAEDAFQKIADDVPVINKMIEAGTLGRKTKDKGGFYRKGPNGKESIDLQTGEYRPAIKSGLASVKSGKKGIRAVMEHEDVGGQLAWEVMRDTLTYAASLVPEIGDDISAIDSAMRAGYNWKRGPFEMIDALGSDLETGAEYLSRRLKEEGREVPRVLEMAGGHPFYFDKEGKTQRLAFNFENDKISYVDIPQKDGVIDLKAVKKTSEALLGNEAGSLWDLGNGVVCAELHGMKETLDPSTMAFLNDAMDFVDGHDDFGSMVIYSDSGNFAKGANLGLVSFVANLADHDKLDDVLYDGQKTLERLKYAPFPVIGAASGMALGGGCEILMHCDSIQAHAESYIGLVETGVGIIPGWGGCKEYLRRSIENAERNPKDFTPPEIKAFQTIAMATVSSSAQDARNKLFLRPHDEITMNRERLLGDAKKKALIMADGYEPPEPGAFRLGGAAQNSFYRMAVDDMRVQNMVTWHDVRVTEQLGKVLSGGDTNLSKVLSDEDMLTLERKSFLPLLQTAQTRARVKHTVTTGRPLREGPLDIEISTNDLRKTLPPAQLKERPVVKPWPVKKAGNDNAPAAKVMPDISKMKPMDAIIATIQHDSGIQSGLSGDLAAVFNQAAQETKEGTLARLQKNKGMAGFLPAEKLKQEVIKGFESSIHKGTSKMDGATDEVEKAKLSASVETMKHYKKLVQNLSL